MFNYEVKINKHLKFKIIKKKTCENSKVIASLFQKNISKPILQKYSQITYHLTQKTVHTALFNKTNYLTKFVNYLILLQCLFSLNCQRILLSVFQRLYNFNFKNNVGFGLHQNNKFFSEVSKFLIKLKVDFHTKNVSINF